LGTTLPIFKLGGGGRIGNGRQWWSWVAFDDTIGAIIHSLTTDSLSGPVNVTSPNPLRNAEYTSILGRVLGRPTLFPLPAPVARVALGEVADELLLASARVEPAKLEETGYSFRYPELEGALRHLLGR
jgi:NAD dependent epimerase/dehydratase family enzyme